MKTKLTILITIIYFAATGQSLPVVVDNSHWFPPAHNQSGPSCTHFALIYNLKSAIWNKEFNRDPSLPENQFSYGFVWAFNTPEQVGISTVEAAVHFMKNQGCATVADYPLDWSYDNMPNFETRTKALFFKSKGLSTGEFWTCFEDKACIEGKIQALKDSLAKGRFFVLGYPVLPHVFDLNEQDNVYHAYENMGEKIGSHAVVVVGYNDTIKTAHGRGAFIIRDSSKKLPNFFFDYNWFYFYREAFHYYFLEEDFSSAPRIAVSAQIKNSISFQEIIGRKYIFVDTTLVSDYGKKIDFPQYEDYATTRNQVQAFMLNGRRLPLRNNWAYANYNTPHDTYEIVFGLPNDSELSNFTSFSIIILDPIAADYIGENGQTIYSYVREPRAEAGVAVLKFLEDDKKITGKTLDLPDTTIVETDFYSGVVGMHLQPYEYWVFVKSCTSILKRKLITFSIEDLQDVNKPPIFVDLPQRQEILKHGANFSFQFKATDPEDSLLSYTIVKGSGASINSENGLFSFQSEDLGDFPYLVTKVFPFTIRVSDGEDFVDYEWSIEVVNKMPPVWLEKTDGKLIGRTGVSLDFRFQAADEEGSRIHYFFSREDDQGHVSLLSSLEASINQSSGLFSFKPPHAGNFSFTVVATSPWQHVSHSFTVEVTDRSAENKPPYFSQVPDGALAGKTGETISFQFKAEDPEGQAISYIVVQGDNSAKIDRQTGMFTFLAEAASIYNFVVRISDVDNNVDHSFSIDIEPLLIPPVFIDPVDTLYAKPYQAITHQFKAIAPSGLPVTFFRQGFFPGSLSSEGLLTFQAAGLGTYAFAVGATDGLAFAYLEVKVIVSIFNSANNIEWADFAVSVYPNPVKDIAFIKFKLQSTEDVDIKLFNIADQVLDIGKHRHMPAGEHILNIDLTGLLPGIYIGYLKAGTQSEYIKIIKQ